MFGILLMLQSSTILFELNPLSIVAMTSTSEAKMSRSKTKGIETQTKNLLKIFLQHCSVSCC